MGGIGSGRRWRLSSRSTTDDYRSIDVRRWHRDTPLYSEQAFEWQWSHEGKVVASISVHVQQNSIMLAYRHRIGHAEWTDERYPVLLDWTTCHLGGMRPWFICPVRGCGRRVAILYIDAVFACRLCYRLSYASQRETPGLRAERQQRRIRERLGWAWGMFGGHSGKPKGMHWKTYEQLVMQDDALAQIVLAETDATLNQFWRSVGSEAHD